MDDLFLNEQIPYEHGAVIKVVGVGGAGGNAVANMIAANVGSVEYIAVNTDAQALRKSGANTCILISKLGLGAGGRPEKGKEYALEAIDEIRNAIKGADMVFITAGMGGGTGTGAAPVIAAEAKASGALTVAVVSTPHTTAGSKRINIAKEGLAELINYVDSYIVVPNDCMQNAGHKLTYKEALKIADDVLRQSIQGICEIASSAGHINIDFADVRTAMSQQGKAVMGIGRAGGENRAKQAFENALKNPLLSDTNIKGAYAVLLNISGNEDDLLSDEVEEIQALVNEYAGDGAHVIDGIIFDDRTDGTISVTIVATGISNGKGVENLTKVDDIKKAKPTGAVVTSMQDKLKKISREDHNLQGISNRLNEDYFEIPTYLRKQND
ncbi:MAG: cell division protein FtsZ [Candidatus Mucispirillum faecigallinarum]|uniref:Cell division protein FtsZ n=1 Tax=Candidatus Mucispirillum faecigallinarum TaxID=2838699 RepID=A0A9D2KCA5_9BACT|nr:cell division protein FtsZ [Mucispirillum sp.]MDY5051832.1 cell division protein FtsZ [Candidatus Mucispirillum faecigallinarum]HIZ89931.1 cell division protein FtsZ [Candidatus Mucispirillum faecigallinarum]